MNQVFVINGPGRSGKRTFMNICRLLLQPAGVAVYVYTSIFPVKMKLIHDGLWDGKSEKTTSVRKQMAQLKKQMATDGDIPNNYLLDQIRKHENCLIFCQIREAPEIEKFLTLTQDNHIPVQTIHYLRTDPSMPEFHSGVDLLSETKAYKDYDFDYVVEEFGIQHVEVIARQFLHQIFPELKLGKLNFADIDNPALHQDFDDETVAGIV